MAELELWPAYSDDSGTKTDGTPIVATFLDAIRDAIEDLVHSSTNPDESPALTTDEVVAARGNAASLDERISVLIDDDGLFVVGGVEKRLTTDITNRANSGTDETDLGSSSLSANTLSANGQAIRVTAWGSFAANGSTKVVNVYFGATPIVLHSAGTNGGQWRLEAYIYRTGAATQVLRGIFQAGSTMTALATPVTPAEDTTGAIIVKVTADGGASSDIVEAGFMVEALY